MLETKLCKASNYFNDLFYRILFFLKHVMPNVLTLHMSKNTYVYMFQIVKMKEKKM